ncbi:MAG: hypothetical protein ACRD20_09090 [Terriglobales bacterium]
MKNTLLFAASLLCGVSIALGQGKTLSQDPLTALPLSPATDSGKHFGNEPVRMPDSQVCRSKMQGNFYELYNVKTGAAVAWYESHLSGFQKAPGYESKRSQTAFFNSDRTILVIITGDIGVQGQDVDAYSVAYERYQPGIAMKTIEGLTHGKILCK